MLNGEIANRAIEWIHTNLGKVGDLSKAEATVVWVTVYRAMEIGYEIEKTGLGSDALVKDMLVGIDNRPTGTLNRKVRESTLKLQFIQDMIPTIRTSRNSADSAMFIEMLKFNNLDAPNQSIFARALKRRRAQIDPMYSLPVPAQIL